jgi:hypothetical protein
MTTDKEAMWKRRAAALAKTSSLMATGAKMTPELLARHHLLQGLEAIEDEEAALAAARRSCSGHSPSYQLAILILSVRKALDALEPND